MKIAIFGATGQIGQQLVEEARARGHEVTAVARHPERLAKSRPEVRALRGDIVNPAEVAAALAGQDAVISAVGPSPAGDEPTMLVAAARSLLEGARRAGVVRVLAVGGAGSLETEQGVQLMDAPGFPAGWKPVARAHGEALGIYRANADLDWTFVSPAEVIEPGRRTGRYRTGDDQVLRDAAGKSAISTEDFAAALLDELEQPRHIRRRFTVAY